MGGGGEVTSDLLSRDSKQQVKWNFSPFVLSIPKNTGGNLDCGPPTSKFVPRRSCPHLWLLEPGIYQGDYESYVG